MTVIYVREHVIVIFWAGISTPPHLNFLTFLCSFFLSFVVRSFVFYLFIYIFSYHNLASKFGRDFDKKTLQLSECPNPELHEMLFGKKSNPRIKIPSITLYMSIGTL